MNKTFCLWEHDDEGIYFTECGKGFYFDVGGILDNELVYCPHCGKKITEQAKKEPYTPMCPFGYADCIGDCNYIAYYYPDWYKELGNPTKCQCVDGKGYDDEDK